MISIARSKRMTRDVLTRAEAMFREYFDEREFFAILFRRGPVLSRRGLEEAGSAVYARGCLIAIANQSEQLRSLNYQNLFLIGRPDDEDRSALLFLNSLAHICSQVSVEIVLN